MSHHNHQKKWLFPDQLLPKVKQVHRIVCTVNNDATASKNTARYSCGVHFALYARYVETTNDFNSHIF